MGISVIKNFFADSDVNSHQFFSDHYFIDDSMLLVRILSLRAELSALTGNQTSISVSTKSKLKDWVDRKKSELEEFYNHGGIVVVIVDQNPIITYQVQGGNPFFIDLISILNNEIFEISYTPITGTEFNCDNSLKELFNEKSVRFQYSFSFEKKEIKSLATTIKSKNIIAFSVHLSKGKLLILPNLQFAVSPSQINNTKIWFADLVNKILKNDIDNFENLKASAPSWANEFIFSNQQTQLSELEPLVKKRNSIEVDILKKEELIFRYDILKSVLYSKGKPLEVAVCRCFEHLNIEYKVPEGSDTDLTIQNGNLFIAIEIKGASGSATKQHTRQLEEWTISCANSQDLEDVKGLLIINAFCEMPLADRSPIVFPPNVVEYSTARQHCLLTTTTLLELVKAYDDKLFDEQIILEMINKTNGVLDYLHVPKKIKE